MTAIWSVLAAAVWPLLRTPRCLACERRILDGHRHIACDDQPIPYRVVPDAH